MNDLGMSATTTYLGKFTFFQTRQSLLMLPSGWFKCWRGEARGGVCQIYYMLEKNIIQRCGGLLCVCVLEQEKSIVSFY